MTTPTPPSDLIQPCPFCGHTVNAVSDGNNGLHFRVICGKGSCRAAGPLERCAADALSAWNARNPQAAYAVVRERIEELTAERDALKHDFDRLAERENQYLNESERFAGALSQIRDLDGKNYDSDRAWALAMQLRASTALHGWLGKDAALPSVVLKGNSNGE